MPNEVRYPYPITESLPYFHPLPHRNSTEICRCTINVELTPSSFINKVATVVLLSFIQPSCCGNWT
jgi:hypothetical protein